MSASIIRRVLRAARKSLAALGLASPAVAVETIRFAEDDVLLVSYPRSGNTWMRHFLANLRRPDKTWDESNLQEAVPDIYGPARSLETCLRPRIIKSHEGYDARYPRVVYIYRDPRDVVISYHNFRKTTRGYGGSFQEFLGEYLAGTVPFGSWKDHVESWVFREHQVPFLSLKYEDMCADPLGNFRLAADFTGVKRSDDELKQALEKSSFEKYRKSVEKLDFFYASGFRGGVKGGPGKWKEAFTPEQCGAVWSAAGTTMEKLGYRRDG